MNWDAISDLFGRIGESIGLGMKRMFGSRNERAVNELKPIVEQVNELEEWARGLSAAEFQDKVRAWKEDLRKFQEDLKAQGQSDEKVVEAVKARLDDLLPEVYALVREAAWRTMKMRHFDVQILGGIVLHRGNIAEMATGEGKTLVATLPACLNALAGRGVFVVTVNDYLARRDRDWMSPVYNYLGLSAGAIQSEYTPRERHPQYAADITYGTNNEFGFDYLRDNMKERVEDQVQKHLFYAIIDEVDSILIDEARTPLIISGPAEESSEKYQIADRIARRLKNEVHFEVNEKDHQVIMTDEGIEEAEKLAGVDSFYSGPNMDWPHHIEQALRAHNLYRKDKDYVVKDGEIIIVDEFTGRLMQGRRWSDGLHQAVEAKEGIRTRSENQTLATITFQNYFRLFDKLAGMTGTALTEAAEFVKIYNLDVMAVPTNRPIAREDRHDIVYVRESGKWKAVADYVKELNQAGRPVLLGTTSIENSEKISQMLQRRGVPHQVLNAKQHEREALIVAQAGQLAAVTVATNMAGRGTDIILGGNPKLILADRLRREGVAAEDPRAAELQKEVEESCAQAREKILELGGLAVIGSERHESRRIDNQLRGRTGRQGDPGMSIFFLSLEDDLMRKFYKDWVRGFMERLGMSDDQPIESGMVTRAIAKAQKKVESRNFEIRKNLLEYDEVMDIQRKEIYGARQEVLEGNELRERAFFMLESVVGRTVTQHFGDGKEQTPDYEAMSKLLKHKIGIEIAEDELRAGPEGSDDYASTVEAVLDAIRKLYDEREEEQGAENMRRIERFLLLNAIDQHWKEHLYAMDALRAGIGLRGYAQQDPKNEYKREGYERFQKCMEDIEEEVAGLILKVRIAEEPPPATRAPQPAPAEAGPGDSGTEAEARPKKKQAPQVPAAMAFDMYKRQRAVQQEAASRNLSQGAPKPQAASKKEPGRNDPCPCGSGKKYKKCHGA